MLPSPEAGVRHPRKRFAHRVRRLRRIFSKNNRRLRKKQRAVVSFFENSTFPFFHFPAGAGTIKTVQIQKDFNGIQKAGVSGRHLRRCNGILNAATGCWGQ